MSNPTPVLLGWSGGKDAAWSLHVLNQDPRYQVMGLLCMLDAQAQWAPMQGVRIQVLRAQAQCLGLPLLEAVVAAPGDNQAYERALAHALEQARQQWPGMNTAAFGDLQLEDVRAYRQAQLQRLHWQLVTPLFGSDTSQLARQMLDSGLQANLCCVDIHRLDLGFAGRAFDASLLEALPADVDPCGENGEFHTCVWAGPMFPTRLCLQRGPTTLQQGRFLQTEFLLG